MEDELPKRVRRKGYPLFSSEEIWGLPEGQKKPSFSETIELYKEERKFEKQEARERRARWWGKIVTCLKETFPMMSEPKATDSEKLSAIKETGDIKLIEFEQPKISPLEKNRRETILKYRHGKYPPFNIEPLPHVRQRLATPMSAEDRARRQEWIKAQILHPEEPMGDPFMPFNPIRRLYRAPLDRFETLLRVQNGPDKARAIRQVTAGALMLIGLTYITFYWLKYNHHTWERPGWCVYVSGPVNYDEPGRRREHYGDHGFSDRKALRND